MVKSYEVIISYICASPWRFFGWLRWRKEITQKFLPREAFARRSFDTQTYLHTETFTQRSLYTEELLQAEVFTICYAQTLLHIEEFTHRGFDTEGPLHTD